MSVVNAGLMLSAPSGYTIDRSLRFRSSASAYLSRTPASAGNRKTWTFSAWVKRGALTSIQELFFSANASTSDCSIRFHSDDTFYVRQRTSAVLDWSVSTNAVFRDPSSWYHILVAIDTTQATSTNRIVVYVNGINQIISGSYPSLNSSPYLNNNTLHGIGVDSQNSIRYLDGYLTEINFIDGQALDPSSFGEYNADTGVWQPIKYTGTYGTNGFYLNFSDNSTTTTLGYDTSGNGNNWTANNISVTSGATYDSMTDVPTLTSEDAANYCTWNGVSIGTAATLTNGNLDVAYSASASRLGTGSTIGVSSGKWYWEVTLTASSIANSVLLIGIAKSSSANEIGTYVGIKATDYGYYGNDGTKYNNNSATAYGASFAPNDVLGFALDMDAGTCVVYKNNVSQGTLASSLTGTYFPAISDASPTNTSSATANFGQRPFTYTPPTGFKSLNTYNLPDSTIEDGSEYFNTVLWTGDNTSPRSITGVGFQPDWTWIKRRSSAKDHALFDAVRGSTLKLESNQTDAEIVGEQGKIDSFDVDGFIVSTGSTDNSQVNISGSTYVAWNWKANGSGVSNTDGSITSTVSANTTAGFSIITYTTLANTVGTVGHGLGVVPDMVIAKTRTTAAAWNVWHKDILISQRLRLDDTSAATSSAVWNSTLPTADVFTQNISTTVQDAVAYCFTSIEGFSKFGSYAGNGSADGPFVYTGFRPAFVLLKITNAAENWVIFDDARSEYNLSQLGLYPNSSGAEVTIASNGIDMLSNGFKLRGTGTRTNGSVYTYIYACFSENPFKNSLAR